VSITDRQSRFRRLAKPGEAQPTGRPRGRQRHGCITQHCSGSSGATSRHLRAPSAAAAEIIEADRAPPPTRMPSRLCIRSGLTATRPPRAPILYAASGTTICGTVARRARNCSMQPRGTDHDDLWNRCQDVFRMTVISWAIDNSRVHRSWCIHCKALNACNHRATGGRLFSLRHGMLASSERAYPRLNVAHHPSPHRRAKDYLRS
jgi:hypothetical protein